MARAVEHGAVRIRLRSGADECEVWMAERGPVPDEFEAPETRVPAALRPFMADLEAQ